MTNPHPASFMSQLVSAVTQLGSRLPSFPCRVLAYRESVPSDLSGSYVSLSGERTEHIAGLSGSLVLLVLFSRSEARAGTHHSESPLDGGAA
jgi:hypothetical protein